MDIVTLITKSLAQDGANWPSSMTFNAQISVTLALPSCICQLDFGHELRHNDFVGVAQCPGMDQEVRIT
jgi:hypothetical protein